MVLMLILPTDKCIHKYIKKKNNNPIQYISLYSTISKKEKSFY